jgi:hypothetical protein
VHAALEFGFHLAQLRLQPFANRLPQHREAPITPLPLLARLRRNQRTTAEPRCRELRVES